MDSVLRAVTIYVAIFFFFKIAGRRTLSEITNFDFVLLLVIGEATQQALLGDDFSITNAIIVISTLIAIDIGLSLLRESSSKIGRIIDGVPLVLAENGQLLPERLHKSRVKEEDILEALRLNHGLETISQIKFAILERNGRISIIPVEQ
jgi:uncharacterized membrane protein YcaP (DUF421 family)